MKTPPSFSAAEPAEADIQKQAYHLWIDGGRVEGVERDNWFAAKELVKHRHGRAHGHAVRGAHPETKPARQGEPSP